MVDYKTEIKYLKISPRKLREIVGVVKKQQLTKILGSLQFMNKKGANILLKVLKSAVANIESNTEKAADKFKIKSIEVNGGPKLKRWRPASRGMAHPYRKYRSHIKLILTDELETKNAKPKMKNTDLKT